MNRYARPASHISAAALVVAAVAFLSSPVVAQTVIPANTTISTDTTWTAAGSPYELLGNVIVQGTDGPDGVTTLTIEPGVVVEYQAVGFFYVGSTSVSNPGALVADGNAGGPATITFTSLAGTPGSWYGIQFRGGARASVLRNVVVEDAGGANQSSVNLGQADGVTVTLDEITVRDSANYGIYMSRGVIDLDACDLGSNGNHDLYFTNSSQISGTVDNCTSIESVFYRGTGPQIDWNGNTFDDWGVRVSRIDPDDAGSFLTTGTFNAPGAAELELVSGTMARDATWTADAGDLAPQGNIIVQGDDGGDGVTTLTLEPGVTVRYDALGYLYVGGTSVSTPGAVVADGNAGGPATITFTSTAGTPGSWYGIQFRGGTRASVLRNVVVEDAGGANQAGVTLAQADGVTVTLDEITVRDSANYGIYMSRGVIDLDACDLGSNGNHDLYFTTSSQISGTVDNCSSIESVFYAGTGPQIEWNGNTFDNWGVRVSRIDPDDAGSFLTTGTFNAPGAAELELVSGTMARDATWTPDAGDLAPQGNIIVQGDDGGDGVTTLTLEPGVTVRYDALGYLYVGGTSVSTPGALVADGNAGSPATITFTSLAGTAGSWYGVNFRGGTRASVLRNVVVEDAGGANQAGVTLAQADGVTVTLDQITVRDSANYGINMSRGVIDLDDCALGSNGNHDIYFTTSSQIAGTVDNCTSIESVFYSGEAPEVTWSGNTFDNWGARVSRVPARVVDPIGIDNTVNKNPGAVLEVLGGTLAIDASWGLEAADFLEILGSLTVQGADGGDGVTTLTIRPGVEIRMANGALLNVGGTSATVPGALVADGDAAGGPATITFTSASDTPTPGIWIAVYFRPGARANSVLRNVLVRYAGSSGWAGIYLNLAAGVSIPFEDVTVEDSGNYGIYQNGDTTLTGVVVRRAQTYGLYLASGATSVANSLFEDVNGFDVFLANNGTIAGTFTGSTLASVFYSGNSPDVEWTGNTVNDWGGARTSRLEPEVVGRFFTENTVNLAAGGELEVIAGTVETDAAWPTGMGNPYRVLGSVTVQGADGLDGVTTLTLDPGLELRMANGILFNVGGTSSTTPGALVADGNAAGGPATITFTSASGTPSPGDWVALYFRAGARANSFLRNVAVLYSGSVGWASIYLLPAAGVTIPLEDVTVEDSGNWGIYKGGDATMTGVAVNRSRLYGLYVASGSTSVTNSSFQDGNDFDIYLASSVNVVGSVTGSTLTSVFYQGASPAVTWSGNTFNDWGGALTSRLEPEVVGQFFADNTVNLAVDGELEVVAGTVETDASWPTGLGNPYHVLGSLTVQGTDSADGITTLTLEPGLELRMAAGTLFNVGGTGVAVPGALIADGDAVGGPARILITSDTVSPAPGDWTSLYFRAGARDSLLRNASVLYSGQLGWAAAYLSNDAASTITFDNVTIRDSNTYGIYVGGPFELSNSIVEANGNFDLYLTGSASVTGSVTDCTSIESVHYLSNVPSVDWTNNTFNNWGSRTSRVGISDLDSFSRDNTFNGIPGAVLEIDGTIVDLDAAWGPGPGPFVKTSGNLTVQGADGADATTTLTLEPGVTIRMPAASWFYVGNTFGDPGELIADGRLGGGAFETVNFNTSVEAPVAGDWNGIHVRQTGRASLAETQVRYADTALMVDGIIDAFDRVSINRTNVGLDLGPAAVLATDLNRLLVRNTGIAVLTDGVDAVVRDSNLIGSTFGVENLTPGSNCVDAQTNWWGAADGPIGDPPTLGCETEDPTGTGSEITDGVLFASYLSAPPDDGDSIPCDDGDGFPDPCTGGNTVDCDDNCCGVSNDSQDDEDGDGTGDACDDNPVLRVSNDPADGADFEIVQDAADASFESGTRVEIFPGLAPYTASVRLDLGQVFTFVGLEEISGDPVVVDGGGGPAFRVVSKAGTVPMTFRNLTIRGDQGVRASVDTRLEDVTFDLVTQEALRLDAGNHQLLRATVDGAAVGARVAAGSSLSASRAVLTNLTDAGLIVEGSADLVNVVIGGGAGADGVRMGAAGSLDARYVTIADNTGTGIENSAGGTVTVDRSIVYGNALDDLVNVPCTSLTWSLSELPDCSAGGDNVTGDPLLDAGYAPQDGSPCLDWGPPAAQYDGTPPTDAAGDVRLRDYDGDGIALNDCGAYEVADDTLVPGEVVNLQWDFNFRLLWDAEPDAVEYHVYRDDLSSLSYQAFGTCRDDLDGDRTDTQLDDLEEPAPGGGWFYLISADDGVDEGSLGFAATAERSNFNPCP